MRQEALHLLQNALEGSGGTAASQAYTESFRLIMRFAVGDKSFLVRIAAARCLKAFATVGGPGLGVGDLENSASYCVKVGSFFNVCHLPCYGHTFSFHWLFMFIFIFVLFFVLLLVPGP